MAAIQASAPSGEEISSSSSHAHLSPLRSITAGGLSPSRKSGTGPEWCIGRMLPPPPQQTTASSTCADANFSSAYPPAPETHQLSQLRTESDLRSLNKQHHPNKRRRLSGGTIPAPSQCHPLGFADSPEPHRHSERSGLEAPARPDLTTSDSLIKLLSDPANNVSTHSPHFGRQDWPQHAYPPISRRESQCCRRACQGPQCATIRRIARELLTEIDARFSESVTAVDPHGLRVREIPDVAEVGVAECLEWALNRLRCTSPPLKKAFANRDAAATEQQIHPERYSPKSPLLPAMKRPSESGQPEQGPYPTPVRRSPLQGLGLFGGASAPEDRWAAHLDPAEPPVPSTAANHSATSNRNESPPNASQTAITLPSPTSLNLPAPPSSSHPSIPSPTAYPPSTAAHVAHLQDLQHQVSVKTLALQTLQREYDNLLQKLERMRTKCATLEKKFEVSDAEINGLTDEKERLEKQVDTLEKLLEEAQNARDEARSASSEQASQYMKIMEMAGQLQAQASEERKKWEMEKARMAAKLTESQTNTSGPASSHLLDRSSNSRVDVEVEVDNKEASCRNSESLPTGADVESSTGPSASTAPQQEPVPGSTDVLLQREINRLEARVQNLEIALRAAEDESKIVREAAVALTGAGLRMESTFEKALTAKE